MNSFSRDRGIILGASVADASWRMGVQRRLKSQAALAMNHPFVSELLAPFGGDKPSIFMLHRLAERTSKTGNHSLASLRSAFAYLRRRRYEVVPLLDLFEGKIRSQGKAKLVAFTIDDGFANQAELAAPLFVEYGYPATVFLISGFLDGRLLPWDYRVPYIFSHTRKRVLSVQVAGETVRYFLRNPGARRRAVKDFRILCKLLPTAQVDAVIAHLEQAADVSTPALPVPGYAPMTWDTARQLESAGISFAPHSVSHGILSRMTQEQALYEITHSWQRLREELKNPVPIFAFPSGRSIDFGIREMMVVKQLGLKGAVSAEPGPADIEETPTSPLSNFQVRRYSFSEDLGAFAYCCSRVLKIRESFTYHLAHSYGGKGAFLRHALYRFLHYLGRFNRYRRVDWSRVRRLVFVCSGNICRSPYAEGRARALGYCAVSVGLNAKSESPANEQAIANALARGIDLRLHKSRLFTEITVGPTDLVVCMEPQHMAEIRRQGIADAAQITLFGVWSKDPRPFIQDPYGRSDAYFQVCFDVIDRSLAGMAKSWCAR